MRVLTVVPPDHEHHTLSSHGATDCLMIQWHAYRMLCATIQQYDHCEASALAVDHTLGLSENSCLTCLQKFIDVAQLPVWLPCQKQQTPHCKLLA